MTTDLEKQFFYTFEIKPYETPSREYDSDGEICSWYVEYPEITDRILLKLICLLSAYFSREQENWFRKCTSIKELKDWVLKAFIEVEKRSLSIIPKYQVQALFKEE